MKPGYKQTEVGVIPEEWEVKSVGELAQIKTGPFGTSLKASEYSGSEGVPLISVGEVGAGKFKITEHTPLVPPSVVRRLPQYLLRTGDVVFGRKGAVERSALVTENENGWFLGSDGISVRPQRECHSPYLACQFQRFEVQSWLLQNATGTTMASLNQAILSRVQIPYAPLPEQRAIATALSDVDALLAALDRLIAKQRDLKQAAMQQLLTGQTRLPGFEGEWVVKTLPDVSRFRGGKAHEQYIADHGRFVCVNSKFISTEGKVRKYSTTNFCSARAKDILMVMSDLPNGKALAKTFVADQDDLYAVNQRVCALTPFDDYCAEFLAYVLDRNPYFLKFDDGVSQTHLLNRVFQKCPVFVPPTKAEQIAIATVLSDMDAALTALEQRRDKTRALKQGMMQELLTGRTRLVESGELTVESEERNRA